jgi:hypothetical protein
LFIGSGKQDPTKNVVAQWFREKLDTGVDLKETDAVLHLRNRLVIRLGGTGAAKIPPYMVRYLTTIAWNKTVLGEECGPNGLRIRMTGPAAMTPPEQILVAE